MAAFCGGLNIPGLACRDQAGSGLVVFIGSLSVIMISPA
jgi:hypothetical protein